MYQAQIIHVKFFALYVETCLNISLSFFPRLKESEFPFCDRLHRVKDLMERNQVSIEEVISELGQCGARLPVRFPTVINDVVSLGKALHPTCLGENVPVLTVSRSV